MNDEVRAALAKDLCEMRRTNLPGYLSFAAILLGNSSRDGTSCVAEQFKTASRGELKRAIKIMRSFQSESVNPQFIENGVVYIRKCLSERGEDLTHFSGTFRTL